jgi:spore photoproduct lyase
MKVIRQKTKTLVTKDNGRSSDAVSPNFIYGCAGGCLLTYCYVARFNADKVYINENVDQILASIEKWVDKQPWPKVPNQCDPVYYTIDIGCSTDVALHSKFYDWQKVFTFFNDHPKLKSTFATKYPSRFPLDKYDINPEKNRIRVSLMPQTFSDILEPYTDLIDTRIATIPRLQQKMEVHINFSPIVVYDDWLMYYDELFDKLADKGLELPCECIFLTYSDIQAERNSKEVNEICDRPLIQEYKESEYGGKNRRFHHELKAQFIEQFKTVYDEFFDLSNIRYIF